MKHKYNPNKPIRHQIIPDVKSEGFGNLTSWGAWYRLRHSLFANRDEAMGAYKLARQQGLDGMGPSVWEWMGLTEEEYYKSDDLPKNARFERPVSAKLKRLAAKAPTDARSCELFKASIVDCSREHLKELIAALLDSNKS